MDIKTYVYNELKQYGFFDTINEQNDYDKMFDNISNMTQNIVFDKYEFLYCNCDDIYGIILYNNDKMVYHVIFDYSFTIINHTLHYECDKNCNEYCDCIYHKIWENEKNSIF